MTHNCGICLLAYSIEENKNPLVISCGHTFCRECITKLQQRNESCCPSCRKQFTSNVCDLPVCYQLLETPDLEVKNDQPEASCELHYKPLHVMCKSCETLICWECVSLSHQECDVSVPKNQRSSFEIWISQQLADRKNNLQDVGAKNCVIGGTVDKILAQVEDFTNGLKAIKKLVSDSEKTLKLELCYIEEHEGFSNVSTDLKFLKEGFARLYEMKDHNLQSISTRLTNEIEPVLNGFVALFLNDLKTVSPSYFPEKIFVEGKNWVIDNDKLVLAATKILNETSVRPSILTLNVSTVKNKTSVKDLLCDRKFSCDVEIECFDESLSIEENRATVNLILGCLDSAKITNRFVVSGYIPHDQFTKMKVGFGQNLVVDFMGLANSDDIKYLESKSVNPICILHTVNPDGLQFLPATYPVQWYSNGRNSQSTIPREYLLRLGSLSDSDLNVLPNIFDKLFNISNSNTLKTLTIRKSKLTKFGVESLIGILRDRFAAINLNIETAAITEEGKQFIKNELEKTNFKPNIVWL